DEHWRDPWVFPDPDGNGWHMLITARANTGPVDDRGIIGHARSPDLFNWEVQPPLSEPGAGYGHLEVFQVEQIEDRHVLIFNCLATELAPARAANGSTGGIWVANADTPLGPYHLNAATPLTDDSRYVGKLVRDPTGTWVMLAFHNTGPTGEFIGILSDPTPVHFTGDQLTTQEPAVSWFRAVCTKAEPGGPAGDH
ncbi:MAG: glycosyl hydrolase family 32, partial [Nakamurella sp.]